MAIGKAGKAFVDAELATRGQCKMKLAQGRDCSPSAKTKKNEAKLRKVLHKCGGVTLSNLPGGGCAATAGSGGVSALADCLITGHETALDSLINDEFGLAASETEVVIEGRMAQATSTLLPPANLARYRAVSTAPLALTDLTLFCVTFADPPTSASSAIGADGGFSLSIAAAGLPFGCFVVDEATGEQVATLVFRSGGTDATQVQGTNGTLDLGTVSLDLGTGEAVVDASGLGGKTTCEAGVTNPVDFTGTWRLTCTPGPPGSGYGCPPPGAPGAPQGFYLHRVPGTDASGTPIYWLGMWDSIDAFKACGQVEGLAATDGGTTTPTTARTPRRRAPRSTPSPRRSPARPPAQAAALPAPSRWASATRPPTTAAPSRTPTARRAPTRSPASRRTAGGGPTSRPCRRPSCRSPTSSVGGCATR